MSREPSSSDSKKVSLLAAVLALALGGLVYSWRATQMPAPAPRSDAAGSAQAPDLSGTLEDVDRLADTVRRRLDASAQPIDLSEWQERTAPPPPPAPTPKKAESAPVGDLRLKGIARAGASAIAFINDKTLEKGESMAGYTVDEIGEDFVVLIAPGGERMTLQMQGLE